MQHILEVIAGALQLRAHLQQFQFGLGRENLCAHLFLQIGRAQAQRQIRVLDLDPHRSQATLRRPQCSNGPYALRARPLQSRRK